MTRPKSGKNDQSDSKEIAATNPWFERLKKSSLGLTVAAVAGLIIAASSLTDASQKLLVFFHLKPNALDIAEDNARGEFSRQLTRLMWQRIYLMRRVVFAGQLDMSTDDRREIWRAYLQNLEVWNTNLMVNVLSLQDFYGTSKRNQFEIGIQDRFSALHSCLVSLGRPDLTYPCPLSADHDLKIING